MSAEYIISAANIETPTEQVISDPTSLTFTATSDPIVTVANGAISDDPESVLRKGLNPIFKGKGWDALISAIASADTYIYQLAQSAFKQLFKSTAEGKYLDRLMANDGLTRPTNIGISDETFRNLGINLNSEKLTLQSLLKILEVYYGIDAMRAAASSIPGPYVLEDGDDLIIEIDGKTVNVVFVEDDFDDISEAEAIEVASAITRFLHKNSLDAFAMPILDVVEGLSHVKIYSGALGLRGSVRVIGGKAQNILNFPTLLATTQAVGTTWGVETSVDLITLPTNRVRFTYLSGPNPTLTLVRKGDFVTIYRRSI